MRQRSWRRLASVAALLTASTGAAGCVVAGGASADADEVITLGYQSKTINTVTAGTLLRARGYFEERLRQLGQKTGTTYDVQWQDYDTGAPITAQMVAGKIDIGSMGDYPLLINGSEAGTDEDGTTMVSVTGYNSKGALNGVVVAADSGIQRLEELKGRSISASVGSAGHGTLVQALHRAGLAGTASIENQDPSVGASALQGGSVDAVSQFVAWPGLLAYRDGARLIYDGGELGVPTLHGVVARREFIAEQPQVLQAFLAAQIDATQYLHEHPLQAAQQVARATGLPAEVVYLYNGLNGIATFDPTVKPFQVAALRHDIPFLESIGVMGSNLDLDAFVDDSHLRKVYGPSYEQDVASSANPAAITGMDAVCDRPVGDPATAGEVWVRGEADTRPVANPTCLLRNVSVIRAAGESLRAAYIPDTLTGTRWLADHMVWLREGVRFYPFATPASADRWQQQHPQATEVTWQQALETVR
jgi:NitT/TauT family transport system substrate-binding protein